MKERKRVLNTRLLLYFTGSLFLFALTALAVPEEWVGAVILGFFGLLLLLAPPLLMPCRYSFDEQGLTLHYLLFPPERYLWKNVYAITVSDDCSSVFDLFFLSFEISGNAEGGHKRYMCGTIHKSRRTKRLLESYWDGEITGYPGHGIKVWWRKHVLKKESKPYRTEEIAAMERAVRADVREWIKPLAAEAQELGLQIHTKYVYSTPHGDEDRRPNEGYVYTLWAEIARPDETDESRTALIQTQLLYVRLGKTAYRGTRVKNVEDTLRAALSAALQKLKERS